jgi:lipopolysaccharide export system protein LptA
MRPNTDLRLLNGAGLAAVAALIALCPVASHAERADRNKPVNIESDRMVADDAKKISTFDGRVVLTQGTLTIRADRIVVRQDAQGFQHGVASGNLATFRQKREGFDDYVEGEAERIEYDGKADRVEFVNRARLRRDGGDDVNGSYISYDSRTEVFSVRSNQQAGAQTRDGRVRAVIMPKNREGAPEKPESSPSITPPPASTAPRRD